MSGATYINSYLNEWGIESSLITADMQEVLVHGSGIWFIGGINVLFPSLFIALGAFAQFFLILEMSKSPKLRNISSKIYRFFKPAEVEEVEPPTAIKDITGLSFKVLVSLLFLCVCLLLYYWLINFSASKATERAIEEYRSFSTEEFSKETLFERKKKIIINKKEMFVYIIAISEKMAALYIPKRDDKEEQILVIPMSSISEISSIKMQHNKQG